jgi:hypothetical protein
MCCTFTAPDTANALPRDQSTCDELMQTFYRAQPAAAAPVPDSERMMRKPQRVCTTLNWQLHQRPQDRADLEGRSLSGLIADLLERAGS